MSLDAAKYTCAGCDKTVIIVTPVKQYCDACHAELLALREIVKELEITLARVRDERDRAHAREDSWNKTAESFKKEIDKLNQENAELHQKLDKEAVVVSGKEVDHLQQAEEALTEASTLFLLASFAEKRVEALEKLFGVCHELIAYQKGRQK